MKKYLTFFLFTVLLWACNSQPQREDSAAPEDITHLEGTFDYDLSFLRQFLDSLIVLQSDNGDARVVISPSYQGRVMTSTANGMRGKSYGWINYDLIASGEMREHINAFGGEDRFWLGPEGGQYAIFFPPEADFTFENWQTPAVIDSEPFEVVSHDKQQAVFTKSASLRNYSGTTFDLKIDRVIHLLDAGDMESILGIQAGEDLQWVGFSSENAITNRGDTSWQKETGLLSIWILGMFRPSPATTVVIPVREEAGRQIPMVNDDYFGSVPEDRLLVKGHHIFFKGDGMFRSKIGVPPQRATPVMGSYDSENQLLTIVTFTLPEGKTDYVNAKWELQDNPYSGDAVNSYNDGPLENGDQLGPFYELESSSPAADLKPGEKLEHVHSTFHFTGEREGLNHIARQVLGVELDEIEAVF